jgi:ATP-binding cassette subfamily B protein
MDRFKTLTEKIQRTFLLRRAVKLVWQCAPGWTLASILLLVIQGVLPLASLYLMKLMIDAVSAALTSPDKTAAFTKAGMYIAGMGIVNALSALCSSIATLVNETQSQLVTDYMHNIIHTKSVEADLAYYENPQYYDTMHRAQQEAPYRPTKIVQGMVQVTQSFVSITALAGLLLSFQWFIAVVLILSAIPSVIVRLIYSRKTYKWQRLRTPTERISWYYHWLLSSDSAAKEIRLFNLGHIFIERYREVRQKLRQERLSITKKRSAADLVTQLTTTLAIYGTFAVVAHRAVRGQITMGDLVMFYQAFQRGQSYLRDILGGLAGLYEDSLFLTNLYEFLDLKPKVVDTLHPKPLKQLKGRGIVFKHVDFSYANTDRKVLRDININIGPHEHIALVGENGSGKTTLIKLLCRLYDPNKGSITWNGTDLKEFSLQDIRKQISVIFQDYAQYYFSVRENIWFGNTHLPPDDARIHQAARDSGADEVIARLPKKYDTILGKWFEDGEQLSTGEWQKIALTRVFLRPSEIVVLDEPTSSLDAKSEYEVFKRFQDAMRNRAAIMISHRLSTARLADRIYVLAGGTVAESGTHDELMRSGGNYAYLFELQARNYR